jgi:prepilin-type N-terminal cleavage/methylation domain-containing protein
VPRLREKGTAPGFTLVEILVVVGVIATLVGLTVAVVPMLTEQSQRRQTNSILSVVSMALEEWEAHADRRISFGKADAPPQAVYDVDEGIVAEADWLGQALDLVTRNDQVKAILTQVDDKFLLFDDKEKPAHRVRDAWGNTVYVVFPGRVPEQDEIVDRDPDGTVRTDLETRLGVAVNRRLALVSAGPDGVLGDLHLDVDLDGLSDPQMAAVAAAEDNIASYPLSRERPE